MNKLQSCDILFRTGSGLISKVIQYFTRAPYSHAALVIDDFHLVEINYNYNLKVRHLKYNSHTYDIYRCESLTEEQKDKIIQFINTQLQRKYDWIYFLSRGFNLLFGTKILNDSTRLNCDELIIEAFRSANVELLEGDSILTPGNLAKSKLLRKIN